jgi:PPOX class probable F420-dependent enzyme
MSVDFSTDLGKMALNQLESEVVIWLTTVTPKGVPQPNPVWFVWEDSSVVIWVQPESARIRNLAQNPRVSLHFVTDPFASHMTVITGEAEVDSSIPPLSEHAAHSAKYADRWQALGLTLDQAGKQYSTPLRVTIKSLRGF